MKRRTGKRKLTRLILAALMATGGGLAWSPSAEAVENWVTESTTISDDQSANSYRLSASGITFTVENGGKVGTVWSPESGNKFNLMAGGEFRSFSNYGGEKNNIWNIYGAVTNTAAAAKIAGGQGNGDGEFSGNEVNIFQGAQISTAVYGGYSDNNATVTNNTVMIAGGTFTDNTKSIYGGYSNGGKADGNTVSISGDTTNIAGDVYGGKANSGNATGNIVTISGGTVGDAAVWAGIRGGNSETRAADGNFVTITGGTINADIWGGQGGTSASNNEVTISGNVTFQATKGIHGGAAGVLNTETWENEGGTASNNVVKILSPISTTYLIGGECGTGGTSTGNTLNLGATGVTVGEQGVSAFQTVAVTEDVAFADGATVLTSNGNEYAKGFSDLETLDISGATGLSSATATGKMTLLASGTENNFTTLLLKYSDGEGTLSASNPIIVKGSAGGAATTTSLDNGVTLTANGGTKHTVSLEPKYIYYTIEGSGGTVTKIDLSNWNGETYALADAYTGANIPVATGSFTAPTGVTTSKTILTSGTANFFGTVSGDRAYKEGAHSETQNGIKLSGTKVGGVKAEDSGKTLTYYAETKTLSGVDLAGWNGTAYDVSEWTAADGMTVATSGMTNLPTATKDILTSSTANYFAKAAITGDNIYQETTSTEGKDGVTLTVTQAKGVKASDDGKSLIYAADSDKKVTAVALGTVAFAKDATLFDGSDTAYQYGSATGNADSFAVTFANPESATAGDTMTLLKANETLAAALADVTKTSAYTGYAPVEGVSIDGTITGKLAKSGSDVTYAVESNKADKLTFGTMAWGDGGALMTRPENITFDGAAVDTSAITFSDLSELKDGDKTLVANFGGTPGSITGDSYRIGAGLKGKGKAEMSGDNLIFAATADSALPDDAVTHSVVMGTEVTTAALAAGNDFIGNATEGLALAGNIGADGISTYAQMGGGTMRQETGSHVDTRTWNAILALGHKNEKEKSTTQYGAFFEYGTGNYTTHNDNERGDGSMHYTGGGLLGKWKQESGFYLEGSLRAGTVKDDARNVLRDGAGVGYSYNTSAGYWGVHLGLGKEIALNGGNVVDVYAKYFHNRRNGVSFDAGGNHYDLDAVTSSVLRVGARYTMKRETWNYYGGLAYEHELDGKAAGSVDGLAIRAAETKGGSARLELGATMTPENSPWSLDLNLTGFAGKKRGLMGGVSVAFMF